MAQAEADTTTRRALFAGGAGLAALALPVAVAAGPGSLEKAWREVEAINARALSETLAEDTWVRLFALEDHALTGPIATKGDLIARLRALSLSFERGPRLDGIEEDSIAEAVRWLEAS